MREADRSTRSFGVLSMRISRPIRPTHIVLALLGVFLFGMLASSHTAGVIVAGKMARERSMREARASRSAKIESQARVAAAESAAQRAEQARRRAADARKKAVEAKRRAAVARERALLARRSRHGLSWPRIDTITSNFGRRHSGFHHGIDILCNPKGGEPIRAAHTGRVSFAGVMPIYGRAVTIEHPNHMKTLYGHMWHYSVRAGQTVKRGQVIGSCGSTGNSTAPHLHFEVYSWGRILNPLSVLPKH